MRERFKLWRLLTIPAYTLLAGSLTALLPLLAPATWLADRLSSGKSRHAFLLFLWGYLLCEVIGLATALALFVGHGFGGRLPGARRDRFLRSYVWLQGAWNHALLGWGRRVFRLDLEVRGEDAIGEGSMLLFLRHSSTGDAALAGSLITHAHGIPLRYVLKKELRLDPCLDVVGHVLPNCFVDRSGSDALAERRAIAALLDDLGPREGVVLYPEGTIHTPARRERALRRLADRGEADAHRRGRALEHVLPPRVGGALSLLEANPSLDVVFCAHSGFEGAAKLHDLWNGAWLGQTIRVKFWRERFAELPCTRAERIEWLWSRWERMDREVGALKTGGSPAPRQPLSFEEEASREAMAQKR